MLNFLFLFYYYYFSFIALIILYFMQVIIMNKLINNRAFNSEIFSFFYCATHICIARIAVERWLSVFLSVRHTPVLCLNSRGCCGTQVFYRRDVVSGVFSTATWLAGCLSQPVLYQNDTKGPYKTTYKNHEHTQTHQDW